MLKDEKEGLELCSWVTFVHVRVVYKNKWDTDR